MRMRGLEQELRQLERDDPIVAAARRALDETVRDLTEPPLLCALCDKPVCRADQPRRLDTRWRHIAPADDESCAWGRPVAPGVQLR
ncbi:hypothetical protein [Mycolicibacterium sphagni]|uniref:hypothetical protein n=1 Tax=Mycolicibacterium sphagni TaxID=1786 RepID=UPI0021F2B45D|nr:hypothetical protein [Mycolicibacterium sphagni]MCV7174873.1 hypothetical protein [Mycolicibacterium sphagni]